MKRWSLTLIFLLACGPALHAQQDVPAIAVWTHSLDSFVSQTKTLLDQIGRAKAGEGFSNLVKSKLGPKGFAGIDATRPIGAFVRFDPDPSGALVVPITGQKEFFDLLDRLDYKTVKEDDGSYRINTPTLFPVYAKIVGQHAWISMIDKKGLSAKIDPAQAFPQQPRLVSVRVVFDGIPKELRQLGTAGLEDFLQKGAAKNPAGSQKALVDAVHESFARFFSQALQDGKELTLDVAFDPAAKGLSVNLNLTPKPDTPLAKSLADAGKRASVFAIDPPGQELSAMVAKINVALPDAVAKAVTHFVEESMLEGAATLQEDRKKQAKDLVDAVKPSLEAGEIDSVFRLVGPGGEKKMGFVFGLKTKDGDRLGSVFKTLAADAKKGMPEAEAAKVMLDADTVGATSIHRIVLPVDKGQLQKTHDVLGDSTLSLAFGPNAMFLAMGWESLPALKRIAEGAKPGPAKLAQVTIDAVQLAPMLTSSPQLRAQAATIFAQKSDGFCQLDVAAGERLSLNLSIRTPVLRFLEMTREERMDEKK